MGSSWIRGETHIEAWRAILQRYKLPIHEERLWKTFGMTNQLVIQFLMDEPAPAKLMNQIAKEKDALFQQFAAEHSLFLPGVKKWMEAFQQNGIRQALASSGSSGNIHAVLKALKVESFFDEIVSGDGHPSKPDPYVFIEASNRLGIVPLNCLVIEDAVAGVQAAKAAGMKCVAVANSNPAEKLADADVVVNNLAELMTVHIQRLFSTQ